ncbi:peptidoglycan editing factor PgeF [Halobacillus salinarum]|uniref:Purine nucleoside phosphorylase n=1 Tax=Halobacillus salinarum TaxID=2932257 RepID=A0ABY4EF84_9BACI|nr:peptidoglycan editing factor PgeF [Halobacillus salinarum]UOQ43125.1 peptidoglycan editing factor PgeF [Halobacillus salinarum]
MTEPFKHESSRQLSCFVTKPKLTAGITTRQGGFSSPPFDSLNMGLHVNDNEDHVLQNRKQLAIDLNIDLNKWVVGEQVHQTVIHTVDGCDLGKGTLDHSTAIQGVDGLITNKSEVLLTAFYADCVPLYFLDEKSGWLGISHAGWKGTVNHMAFQMIEALKSHGADPEDIQMIIGPCISKKHYEVDERVISQVNEEHKHDVASPTTKGKYLLDLKMLNKQIALQAGLLDKNISMTSYCTYEEEELFFSHRRDGGQSGRMLGYIGWLS